MYIYIYKHIHTYYIILHIYMHTYIRACMPTHIYTLHTDRRTGQADRQTG